MAELPDLSRSGLRCELTAEPAGERAVVRIVIHIPSHDGLPPVTFALLADSLDTAAAGVELQRAAKEAARG